MSWLQATVSPAEAQRERGIVTTDERPADVVDKAIEALPLLIKTKKEREKALVFAKEIALADEVVDEKEQALIDRIKALFEAA